MNVLESNVGVENDERAEDCVHDRIKRASSEGGNGERDKTGGDGSVQSLVRCPVRFMKPSFIYTPFKGPVVASLRGVRGGDGSRVVHYVIDRLVPLYLCSKQAARFEYFRSR